MRLQIFMIRLGTPELYLGVQRALAPQTPSPLLLRNKLTLYKRFLALRKFLDLPPLPFVKNLVHVVVRSVAEGFKADELCSILNIPKLLVGPPADEMVILEYKRLRTLALLCDGMRTSCRNELARSLTFMLALSL